MNFQSHLAEARLFGIKEKEKRKCSERGKDPKDRKKRLIVISSFIDSGNSQSHLLGVPFLALSKMRSASVLKEERIKKIERKDE